MTALLAIAWLVMLLISIFAVFQLVGAHLMVQYFPEGRVAWLMPAQLASLVFFAAVVLYHPF